MSGTLDRPPHWFALRVRSNQERKVALSLATKDIEHLLPLSRQRRRWSDRMRDIEVPLFKGYVFSRFCVERRLPILQTPGVVDIVGHGKMPVPVDDPEMEAIQQIAASSETAEPWPYLRVGTLVRVDRGPLEGLEGRLVAIKKPARLVVSVTLLQRAVAVEIEEYWVTPIAEGVERHQKAGARVRKTNIRRP